MNIFSVGDGAESGYELTRETYMDKTHKDYPFYQDADRYKNPYFALCPACGNPIQIINLFGKRYEEEKTRRTNLHGRHYRHNVEGLANYSEEGYLTCPLHNPIAFRIREIRKNELVNEEIKDIVERNRKKICADIRKIIGVFLNNDRLNGVIDDYIKAKDYCYTHTNKFNIPYSILYTREAISIFGQKISDSGIGQKIRNAIQENSLNFTIDEGRVQRTDETYVSLKLLVVRHKIQGGHQYMTIRIEEQKGETNHIIFEEEIEMKQYIY